MKGSVPMTKTAETIGIPCGGADARCSLEDGVLFVLLADMKDYDLWLTADELRELADKMDARHNHND